MSGKRIGGPAVVARQKAAIEKRWAAADQARTEIDKMVDKAQAQLAQDLTTRCVRLDLLGVTRGVGDLTDRLSRLQATPDLDSGVVMDILDAISTLGKAYLKIHEAADKIEVDTDIRQILVDLLRDAQQHTEAHDQKK